MPLIQCHVARGLSSEQKRGLVSGLVEATVQTLGADRTTISVVLHEHEADNIRMLEFVERNRAAHGNASGGG